MKRIAKPKLLFFFLGLLFIAPGLSAYVVYMHPQWLNQTTTNKGHLLKPPRPLSALGDEKTWRIMLWSPNGCDPDCMAQVEQLERVRLALGRRFYDVQFWVVQRADAPRVPSKMRKALRHHAIHSRTLSTKEIEQVALPSSPAIFLVNPMHYLILQYSITSEPNDIFHDIKLLLTTDKASN